MVPANLPSRSIKVLHLKKGSGLFCRNGPQGALHKRVTTPFSGLVLRPVHFLGLCWLFSGAVSCLPTAPFVQQAVAPSPAAYQVVATWYPEVVVTPDPAHGGAPVHGLAGRVYLFGPEISFPLAGDGTMVVDLFNDTPDAKATVPLEEWRFDKDTLKRLQRRDAVGWGYTLFLPWGTYQPEIKRVHLRLRYEPAKGAPLYTESPAISLKKEISSS
jgi:hypothetical protein